VTADADTDRLFSERDRLTKEAGLGSSLFVEPEAISIDGLEARFPALRRQFIGGRLSWEALFEYRIRIEPIPPTRSNPYGFAVRHLTARKVENEVADPH